MDDVDESAAQAELSRKEDDTKLPIDLRNLEQEEKNDVINSDSFVEEGLVACESVVSRFSSGEMMMGQKSDSFDIQDNEV